MSEKKLTPLNDHNAKMEADYAKKHVTRQPNGFACPNCQKELVDVNPDIRVRTQTQTHTMVACPACAYTGIRYLTPEELGT